jgi:hypothetical protein
MKKHCAFGKMVFLTAILLSGPFFAMTFAALAEGDDVVKHSSCPYCGMDRAKFDHSRIYVWNIAMIQASAPVHYTVNV